MKSYVVNGEITRRRKVGSKDFLPRKRMSDRKDYKTNLNASVSFSLDNIYSLKIQKQLDRILTSFNRNHRSIPKIKLLE